MLRSALALRRLFGAVSLRSVNVVT